MNGLAPAGAAVKGTAGRMRAGDEMAGQNLLIRNSGRTITLKSNSTGNEWRGRAAVAPETKIPIPQDDIRHLNF